MLVKHRGNGPSGLVGTRLTYATHPLDVVGWDGCLYPYTFNVEDFMPITGKVHQPPPVHQVFEGYNFVVCNFCPRKVDYHEQSIPVPYYHSNVDSDEVMFYVGGDYEARKGSGIGIGSISLHPGGYAHGPQPSAIEASIGVEYFDELAVMVDTFRPLELGEAGLRGRGPGVRLDLGGPSERRPRRRSVLQQLMAKFVAFLRAVNVGKRKYPMAELREALTDAGFEEVETHIQTGNVLFRTSLRSRAKVIAALEKAMREDRGFEVPVVLLTPAELTETHAEACDSADGRSCRATTSACWPSSRRRRGSEALEARSDDGEEIRVGERAVHLMLTSKPFHEAKTGNAEVEKELGVATTRNLTVISKLAEKWGS